MNKTEHTISVCHKNGEVTSFTLLKEGERYSQGSSPLLTRMSLLALGMVIHFLGKDSHAAMNCHKLLEGLVLYINAARSSQKLDEAYATMTNAILQGVSLSKSPKLHVHLPKSLLDSRLAVTDMVRQYLTTPKSQLELPKVVEMMVILSAYGGRLVVTVLPDSEATLTGVIQEMLNILLSPRQAEQLKGEHTHKCTEHAETLQHHIVEELREFSDSLSQLAKQNEQLSKELEGTHQFYKEREKMFKEETQYLQDRYSKIEMMLQQQGIEYRELIRELQREVQRLNSELAKEKGKQKSRKRVSFNPHVEEEDVDFGCTGDQQAPKAATLEEIVDHLTIESQPEDVGSAIVNTLGESLGIVSGGNSVAVRWEVMSGVSYVHIKMNTSTKQ